MSGGWQRFGWAAFGLGLAAALAWTPPLQRAERAWQDLSLRQLARTEQARSTLVVDLDASSIDQLRPAHGEWPFSRRLHAQLVQRLLDAGAEVVVLNLLLEAPREGDEALRELAERHPRRVVLAAAAGRLPDGAAPATGVGWPGPLPAVELDGVRLPAPTLRTAGTPVGLMSVPWGADGVLRCLPLLLRVEPGLTLPSLPVAALNRGGQAPRVEDGAFGRSLQFGPRRWPIDAHACLLLRLPRNADAVPALRYAALVDTPPWSAGTRDAVRGRTVFIGSPSLLDLRVMTPIGQIGGTQWQALAHEALTSGRWLAPTSPIERLLWLAAALLPAGLAALRARPRLGRDLTLAGGTALLLVGLGWLVQQHLGRMAPVVPVLLLIGCGALAGVLRWQRWVDAERVRALADRAAAQASSRAKSEFLAHVSHEIRTPLNAVLGMSQLLAETPLNETQRRYVDVFASAGRHLQQLIEDMLDLSRVEAGRLELQAAPFDPRALADELHALFEPRAAARGLRLHTVCAPALPAHLHGDAKRVRQVLVNLLGNAMKFTSQGEVRMTVMPTHPGWVEWVVSDTGVGIAPDRQGAVFEPFTQAEASTLSRFGGSGLGLTISRRLATLMGGEVTLRSEPGRGTTVTLTLPMPATEGPPPAPGPTDPGTAVDWRGRRVLLAEDNPHNVAVVQGMLADTGVVLELAGDGRSAVEMAARRRYDLILMDVQMPGLDGHAATREIRQAEHAGGLGAVPVLALSANAMPSDRQASLRAGCDMHLSKPIDKAALRAALATYLACTAPPTSASAPGPTTDAGRPALLDRGSALARLGGDRALYERVRVAAIRQFDDWPSAFADAAAAGDLARCRRLAHDIKSVAGTVGAQQAALAAAELERCCQRPQPALELPAAELRDALAALSAALREP